MGTMCPNHTEQNQGHDPGTGERHSMYADQGDTTEVCPTGRHGYASQSAVCMIKICTVVD